MKRLRQLARQAQRPVRWWNGLTAPERILYRSIALLGVGSGLIWPPLLFLIPGLVFALVFFGFSFRRST